MRLTPNYSLKKPEGTDPATPDDFNTNADILDKEVAKKLDKTGNGSEVTNTFAQAESRTNLESGEEQSVSYGKISKWFADLKGVAFSGKAVDVTADATHRFTTDVEKTSWNGKVTASGGDASSTTASFEDYTGSTPIPDAETALVGIKTGGKLSDLLSNIKAVLKGTFLKKYILTTMEEVMANTVAGRTADALLLKEVNSDFDALKNHEFTLLAKTVSTSNAPLLVPSLDQYQYVILELSSDTETSHLGAIMMPVSLFKDGKLLCALYATTHDIRAFYVDNTHVRLYRSTAGAYPAVLWGIK